MLLLVDPKTNYENMPYPQPQAWLAERSLGNADIDDRINWRSRKQGEGWNWGEDANEMNGVKNSSPGRSRLLGYIYT